MTWVWLTWLCVSVGIASESEVDVSMGWYLKARGADDEAARYAVEGLQAHPNSLALHRLYTRVSRDRLEPVQAHYRDWLAEEPENPIRRLTYAYSLLIDRHEASDWCERARMLLDFEPATDEQRFHHLKTDEVWQQVCDGDPGPVRAKLIELGVTYPPAQGKRLKTILSNGDDLVCSDALKTEVAAFLEQTPWKLYVYGSLFTVEDPSKCVQDLREQFKALAMSSLESDDPRVLYYSAELFSSLDMKKQQRLARARLVDVAPMDQDIDEEHARPSIREQIKQANRQPTNELALRALKKLDNKVPESGEERSLYRSYVSARLGSLGRFEEQLKLAREAYERDSSDPDAANEYASLLTRHGGDLELALRAANQSVAARESCQYDSGDVFRWRFRAQRQLAASLDTRGWLYYRLGRYEEAIEDLSRAVMESPIDGNILGHLGLALVEAGHEAPQQVLYQALRMRIWDDQVRSEVEEVARRYYESDQVIWNPQGFQGYVKALQSGHSVETDSEKEQLGEMLNSHSLVGEVFPISRYRDKDGEERSTADLEADLLVVDLWATWCGPCVAGMPHLQVLASEYKDRGVRFLSLSLDKEPAAVDGFFKRFKSPAYHVGWYGPVGFDDADVTGIPSLFVLDKDLQVVEYISGYLGGGDTRLEDAIEEALSQ